MDEASVDSFPDTKGIPAPYVHLVSDAVALLNMSFGMAGLLLVLCLDAWRSKTKKAHWIPGDSLVVGALSIQLLGMFHRPLTGDSSSDTGLSDENHNNLLLNLGGRVVTCVCFGIFLSDVARSRKRSLWSDMLALSISATGVLIHLSYDIFLLLIDIDVDIDSPIRKMFASLYVLNYKGSTNHVEDQGLGHDVLSCQGLKHYGVDYQGLRDRVDSHGSVASGTTVLMLATNMIIFASIVLLVLLLGCGALASKSIQDFVAQRSRVLLSPTKDRKPGSVGSVDPWEAVEEHAVRSWITARTHQPQYIMARSVLSSSIGFVVTICVAVSIVASMKNGYRAENDRMNTLRVMAFVLQWIFILSGWAIVCWRWVTAVVYYPRRMGSKGLGLGPYFRVEDFWKTTIVEIQEELMELDEESIKKLSYLSRFLFISLKKLRLYKLLPILLLLQTFLVLLSKTCWLISEMVFSNRYTRKLLMGSPCQVDFEEVYNLPDTKDLPDTKPKPGILDFRKYSDCLMHMPEENPAGLWIAHRQFIQQLKARMKQGENDGKKCKALISLLNKTAALNLSSRDPFSLSLRRKLWDFSVEKSSPKMMVVSLLTVVIELSHFYQGSSGSFGRSPTDTVNDCIQACCQAWKIMEFGEKSDHEAVRVNKYADRLFHNLKGSRRWFDVAVPINKLETRTVEEVKRALEGLEKKAKQTENTGCDSKNGKAFIAGETLRILCENIKNHPLNVEELLDEIQNSLADVIGSCMFELGEIIMDECRLWAQAFMDEKLWDAFYEAGRANGVIQGLSPGVTVGRQIERIHSI